MTDAAAGKSVLRVIVCGGRDYSDIAAVRHEIVRIGMDNMHAVIVHGAARGADSIARFCAEDLGLQTEAHPANWDKYGKRAGFIRNQEMADAGADLCVAFPGGNGTADMIRRAEAAGIPCRKL